MRTYTIDIDDGRGPDEPYALELPDLQAARMEAARLLGEMVRQEPENFWQAMNWQVLVKDETGLLLFELHALAVEAPAVQRAGPRDLA